MDDSFLEKKKLRFCNFCQNLFTRPETEVKVGKDNKHGEGRGKHFRSKRQIEKFIDSA